MRLDQIKALAPDQCVPRLRNRAILVVQEERRVFEPEPPDVEPESCGFDICQFENDGLAMCGGRWYA